MGSRTSENRGARTPWWIWLVISVAAAGAVVATALVERPPPIGAGTAAEGFLAADGTAWVLTMDDSTYIVESAWDTGVRFALQAPGPAGESMIAEIEEQGGDLLTAHFWRRTITALDSDLPQIVQVFLLSDTGVAELASTGGNQGFAFRPALQVLPARPAPGISWTQEGAALPFDLLDYTTRTAITGFSDGCLELEDSLSYIDPVTDESLYDSSTTSTICLGMGPTGSSGADGGTASSQSLTAFTARTLTDLGSDLKIDWDTPEAWTSTPVELMVEDSTFGTWPALDIPNADVDFTTSGIAVIGYGPDAIGYRVDGAVATRAWIAHPGGTIVSSAALGNVVLLGTSERELVAYDDAGRRAWTIDFPDAVRTTPVSDEEGGAVAVALDGTVIRMDLATGAEIWRASAGVGSVVDPVVADGVVYVADRDDIVHAVDLETGDALWTASLLSSASFLLGDADGVLVGVGNGTVLRLARADGSQVGRIIIPGVPRRAVLMDDGLVVQSDAGTTGFAGDGTQRFHLPEVGRGLVSDGVHALVIGGDGTTLLIDALGTELASFPGRPEEAGLTDKLVLAPHGAWFVSTDNAITALGTS